MKVDAATAANCRALGMKLSEIRAQIAPEASLMAVSRALRRARRTQNQEPKDASAQGQ